MRRSGIAGVAGVLLAAVCPAATIRVPEDSPSILAAVDLAMPGDSVLVGPGVWTDRATRLVVARNGSFVITACAFPRGGVVIRGSGSGVTTLDATGPASGFPVGVCLIERTGQGVLQVEAMTLTGAGVGVGEGRAVTATFSDGVEARDCRFEGNLASSGAAVGVLACPLTLVDCEVVGNTSPAGVVQVDHTTMEARGCRFEENSGRCVQTFSDPGSYNPVIVRDCEFVENRGRGTGVCLNVQSGASYVIERSLFLRNVAEIVSGAAIRTNGSSGQIQYNVFAYDSCYAANSGGAGVWLEGGLSGQDQATVVNNTFVGCYATLGGAAFVASRATVTFRGNVVSYSPRGAGVAAYNSVIAGNSCNLWWANTGGHFVDWTPGSTDVFADPFFCDLANLDFTVRNDSPCIVPPTPSCAPIGALGVGCGIVALEATSFGRVKALFR